MQEALALPKVLVPPAVPFRVLQLVNTHGDKFDL